MKSYLATDFKKQVKLGEKAWLYVQDADNTPLLSSSSWNEGYLPTDKFLYFSEASSTLKKIKKS